MTVNSEFPASGENELKYDNNYAKKAHYQFRTNLALPNNWACTDTKIQLQASHENGRNLAGIDWTPSTYLSCTACLDPIFTLQDVAVDQEVIITSQYFCRDTIDVTVPPLEQNIPVPTVSSPPDLCPGTPPLNLNTYVNGTNIRWYPTENAVDGSNTTPTMDTVPRVHIVSG